MGDNLVKTRSPLFLSSYGVSHIPEVMSPIESDYESFQYYQKMLNITKSMVSGKRGPVPEEMKLFKDMTFKQFYNTYKVIRTIQLGKEFNNTKEEEKQEDEDTTQDNIDDAVNLTNYFADVVNQFRCASCYSFPIAATVEYEYRKYGIVVKLSEQQLIDCAHDDP